MMTNIEPLKNQIAIAEAFAQKYQQLDDDTGRLIIMDDRVCLAGQLRHAPAFGEAFGKEGWTRRINWNGKLFDWHKEIDGVKLTIYDAEQSTFNGTMVNPKDFPILLKNE